MRVAVLACVFAATSPLGAAEPALSMPPVSYDSVALSSECRDAVMRDLDGYFRDEFHAKEVLIDIEPVLASPTEYRAQRPVYYVWLRVSTPDARNYQTGVARVMTGEDLKCRATGFIPRKEILASPTGLGEYFPEGLIPKILSLARTPQK
jgi:hypothetical protein